MASPHPFDPDKPDIIEFTPPPGAKIEKIAPFILKKMEELDMDAEIHFPTFTLEVPRGAAEKDIIETYNKVMVDYLPDLRQPPRHTPPRGPKLV